MLYRLRTRAKKKLRARNFPTCLNDYRLQRLENKHQGEKCVIVAMGPSLKTSDLDLLVNIPTFACNKIYLAFDETNWRPTYYTVIDVLVAENNQKEISNVRTTRLFPSSFKAKLKRHRSDIFYDYGGTLTDHHIDDTHFSTSLVQGILAGGYSVVLDQVQLAYAMGFQKTYIIGLDFSFQSSPSTGKTCEHGEVLKSKGEVNHFHPQYRKKGETWTAPRLDKQEEAFSIAKTVFDRDGRELINASRESQLSILKRVSFENIFD